MNSWKVGQQVWLIPSMNDRGEDREPKLVPITRVGSKYVYIEKYGREVPFSAIDGVEKTNYTGSARVIRTPEKHARVQRMEAANRKLQDLGIYYRNYGPWPWSVDALEQVIKVLEDDAAITAFEALT